MKKPASLQCILLLLVMLPVKEIFSQNSVPGYVGKLNTAGYSAGISISGQSSEMTNNGIGLVCSHNFTFERCVTRKLILEGNLIFAPSKYHLPDYFFNSENKSAPEYLVNFVPDYFVRAYLGSASLGIKLFRKQFIAPVGRFIRLRVGMITIAPIKWKEGIPGEFTVYQSSPAAANIQRAGFLKTETSASNGLLFSFGFGKVIPLNDRLLFEFANNFNINYSTDYGFNLFERQIYSNTVDNYIFSNLHSRMKERHLIDFQFGLKYNF